MRVVLNERIDELKKPLIMPEPPDFGFEDIIKLKAELDAELSEQIQELMSGRAGFVDKGVEKCEVRADDSAADLFGGEYVYNYDLIAEFAALKLKKKPRLRA